MFFLCKKTVEMPTEENAFLEGKIYQDFPRATSRTHLALVNEQGCSHTVGLNRWGWKYDALFKKYFAEIKSKEILLITRKNGYTIAVLSSTLICLHGQS